jgi:hypothetical protein
MSDLTRLRQAKLLGKIVADLNGGSLVLAERAEFAKE